MAAYSEYKSLDLKVTLQMQKQEDENTDMRKHTHTHIRAAAATLTVSGFHAAVSWQCSTGVSRAELKCCRLQPPLAKINRFVLSYEQ